MDVLRTPDERFADLPGWPYEPRYAQTSDGLRTAYVDEGSGPTVLLLHGEPSWGYLYRHVVPVLVEAGFRCVVPDLVGFGRSDKPAAVEDYTYARHVEWLRSVVFDALDLTDVTLVCQDWGGLLGLRLVAEHPQRFARVCAANTGLPDGTRRLPDAWWRFRDFVARTDDLPIGVLVASGCAEPLAPQVQAAYDAPFPDASYKAGPKAFPDLIPQDEGDPATPDNQPGPDHRRRRAGAGAPDPRCGGPAPHDDRGRRALPAGGPRRRARARRRRVGARLRLPPGATVPACPCSGR